MINIVHYEVCCNDRRAITAIVIKLKFFREEGKQDLYDHALVATVSAAFYRTTLLTDVGESLTTSLNPKRGDIINLKIAIKESAELVFADVGNFMVAFQRALDETNLQF